VRSVREPKTQKAAFLASHPDEPFNRSR
jgi:hypothetical protein